MIDPASAARRSSAAVIVRSSAARPGRYPARRQFYPAVGGGGQDRRAPGVRLEGGGDPRVSAVAAFAPGGSVVTKRARRRARQWCPGATALGWRRPVDSAEGRRDGGRVGDASVRSGGGGWGELDEGRRAFGVLAAESAAADQAAASRADGTGRRRPVGSTEGGAMVGGSAGFLSPPLPFHGIPSSGIPGPLSWSHGEVTSECLFSFLLFFKNTSTRYSFLPSLYRREKETGCPKGNPVIRRGFGPKIG